ncbi:uncharacterized protein DS421_20g700730 [Arachis hypogaea]|nr:uncharacterized protein DS421_20g700730 [Arachis hypogaea]
MEYDCILILPCTRSLLAYLYPLGSIMRWMRMSANKRGVVYASKSDIPKKAVRTNLQTSLSLVSHLCLSLFSVVVCVFHVILHLFLCLLTSFCT